MNYLILVSFIMLRFAVSCISRNDDLPFCEDTATVRNLNGLDGCGYVLELADGKRLIPIQYQLCRDERHQFAYGDWPIDVTLI